MPNTETRNSEVARIIEKYGEGFDVIYFDGKADGFADAKVDDARKLLAEGVDEGIISRCTGISIDDLIKFKRTL